MNNYLLYGKHFLKFSCLLLFITGLSACEHAPVFKKKVEEPRPQLVAEPDNVSLMLADAAGRASKALETLASIEQYRTPQEATSTIPNAPRELKRGMSVQWVGPPEPLIKAVADQAGYQFSAIGAAPATPIIISVDAYNKQIIDVLRGIGLQLGKRANLNVDASRRAIELQYVPTNATFAQ